jgi:hypothetical protein
MIVKTKVEYLKDKGIFGKCTWVPDRYQSTTPHGFTRYALSLDDDERKDNDSLASLEIKDLNDAINLSSILNLDSEFDFKSAKQGNFVSDSGLS